MDFILSILLILTVLCFFGFLYVSVKYKKKDIRKVKTRRLSKSNAQQSYYGNFTRKNIQEEIFLKDVWIQEVIESLNNYRSLSDLLIVKDIYDVNYSDLLQCFEWKFKRLQILLRDCYKCFDCGLVKLDNHVHHTYYLKDHLPWIIEDQALTTLCYKCHVNRHQNSSIPVYKKFGSKLIEVQRENPQCRRCGGTGYIPAYSHVQNGICFACKGDLIDKTVFSLVLNKTYERLNDYNDKTLRNHYKLYLSNITSEQFISKVPNYYSYKKSQCKSVQVSESDFYEDDLPF